MMDRTDKPFPIPPHYDVLLRGSDTVPIGLYQLHQATAVQLCRLHYALGSLKAVKEKLKVLAEHGFVQADRVPTRQFSSPYYYMLGDAGVGYLKSLGYDTNEAWRSGKELNKSWLFLDHALEVNDVLISAALLHRTHPAYTLERFLTDRRLKRRPYHVSWMTEQGRQNFTVIPDTLLEFSIQGNRLPPILLEHDRGTEEQQHFRRRIRAYAMLIKSEGAAFTVAFTTFKGQRRLDQMRRWAATELQGEPISVKHVYRFASLTQPLTPAIWISPLWQTLDDTQFALLVA